MPLAHSSEHEAASRPLSKADAEDLAGGMQAFATASRLRLLWAMLEGERTVEALVEATEMNRSAVSQQLRVLRQARLVAVRRDGRRAHYRLHDHHVPELLAAMRHHQEHLSLPPAESPPIRRASKQPT